MWPLVLVHVFLLQLAEVRGRAHLDLRTPGSLKLQRLHEQFQQFEVLTRARLDMLALNQKRNSSRALEKQIHSLSNQYQRISKDLDHLRQTSPREIAGLSEWNKKLEKKSKRMEGRVAMLERGLRENNRRLNQKQKPDSSQNLTNLTLHLQRQESRLDALEAQREELLVRLKGLQESLENQGLKMKRMEGRLTELLQGKEGGYTRGSWRNRDPFIANRTPQKDYEPRRRSKTSRGGTLDRHTKPQLPANRFSQFISSTQSPATQNKVPSHTGQHQTQLTSNQPKRSKTHFPNKTPRPQRESQPQPNLSPQTQLQYPDQNSTDSQPQPHLVQPQHHHRVQLQTHRSPPVPRIQIKPHQVLSRPHQSPYPTSQPHDHHQYRHRTESQIQTHPPNSTQDRGPGTDPPTPTPQHGPGSHQRGEVEEKEVWTEDSDVHNFLQLPVRQKIPAQPVPRKDATICNVDSILFFPSASIGNYVTFARSLPTLPELSVCLWLHVEAQHIGTLLSYATDDNDNQLVLYGRRSSFSSSSSSSSKALDFVVGDPVYRRLPAGYILDGHWHHLCVIWSSIQGRFWHYTDRRLTSSGSNFQKGWEVPGGGSVVLGQEQDTVGGGFDQAEGFAGRMAGFTVWDRMLSRREVEGVAEGRGLPRGVVLGMEDIAEVHGEVKQVACECLEYCM